MRGLYLLFVASTKDDHPHDVSGPCNVPEAGCSGKLKKKKKGKKVHHESKIISKDAGEMNNQDIGDNHFHIHWKGNKDRFYAFLFICLLFCCKF